MSNLILSPIPIEDLLKQVREIVTEVVLANLPGGTDKLLSPAEACKLFDPVISRQTLTNWTREGLIPMQKIGGRVFYKYTDVMEAGTRLVRYKNPKP